MEFDEVIDSRYGEANFECPHCEANANDMDWDTECEVVTDKESLDGYRVWFVRCLDCGHEYTVKDWRSAEEVAQFVST